MKAAIVKSPGENARFEILDRPTPSLSENQIRVAVHAASVNVVDSKVREGLPLNGDGPLSLGCDLSGVVLEVGRGVTRFAAGDAVYGCVGGVGDRAGTYAEQVVSDAALFAFKPETLSHREAAALPLVAITAWEAVIDRARVQPGERVLVLGGAGGVGHLAVQLARLAGGIVHAVVRDAADADIARGFGADDTASFVKESPAAYVDRLTGGEGYDVVIDTVGSDNIATAFEAVAINGRVVTIVSLGSTPDLSALHTKNASLHVVFMLIPMLTGQDLQRHGDLLARLTRLVDAGRITPRVDATPFTLETLNDAHARLQAGQAEGKLVIDLATA